MAVNQELTALDMQVCTQLVRGVDEERLPQLQHANRRLEVQIEHRVLRHLEYVDCESRHHSERRRAGASQSPEQVRLAVAAGGRHRHSAGQHHIHRSHLIAGESVESGLHALPSASHVTASPNPCALAGSEGPLAVVPQIRVELAQSDS